jgi:hypothetical protein
MNALERILDSELTGLMDRLAASVPERALSDITAATPTLRARLDEAEARAADVRAALLADYGRWRRALEDLENLWALASWRSGATEEPVEQAAALVAA